MPWIIALIIAVVASLAYFGWKKERQRRDDLAALAQRLGMQFHPGRDTRHDDRYRQFEIFRRGHSRVATNTLVGAFELLGGPCRTLLGDFAYEETSTDADGSSSTTTYRFSYLIVHVPWECPALLVRPEGIFDKIKGALGFDDIDFESDEFSRKFYVMSPDKRFAYDVLHPRMMEFLLATKPPMIDLEGGAVCVGGGARRWSPAEFEQRLEWLRQFCDLWPRHLVRELEA